MTDKTTAYQRLEARFHDICVLEDTIRILHWDQATIMPSGGAEARAEQLARLEVMRHEKLTASDLADDLSAADAAALDVWPAANLREMRRIQRKAVAVPADLVAAHSRACSLCEIAWRKARQDDDFSAIVEPLGELLNLTRDVGTARGDALDCSLYDALLQDYEPGASSEYIDPLFDDLAAFLPDFLDDVLTRQDAAGMPLRPIGPFDTEAQRALCRRMAETVGLDFDTARVDESAHPFSSGVPEDSRITVRYNEDDFGEALMAVLHESGHAMYERGRPDDWRYQPVGRARGMVLHESQSLLLEMQACRTAEFYHWATPALQEAFDGNGPAWTRENLLRWATKVERGLIRVDADEVTYPAHVILRYRLEKAMLSGDLALPDLPAAWNDGMKGLLGVVPPDDRQGCLQDIHWYSGAWGYFPTYTLGALAAAQLFQAATTDDPGILPSIQQGDFVPLMNWLRRHVHGHGSCHPTDDLIRETTGAPLAVDAFKAHLRQRYLDG